jgi:non-specific serine/threonine protein kinase/serine/threonine-protein kinase
MDAARWQTLETLFAEAVELPIAKRAAFCDRACADDPSLREELRSLLSAHETVQSLLDRAPNLPAGDEALPPAASPGTRVGVWRLGALIRRGGAGEVYAATRADGGFEQAVALKLLYREAAPDIERFHAERQILASLEHPGIARLLDGGVADDGRLYAVVEYVEGEPITEHCTLRHADLAYRLALFLQVCDVVSYAHRNLIVHRDLKPGNILVTPEGRVKLLDFGVAKRLDRVGQAGADQTSAPYTSDYAAPEQLTGQAITTATDVYALGVLLFELLTGQRPWRSDGLPIARVVQLIVHDEAPTMSRAMAATPTVSPPVAARSVAGDLDAIVATCLRKGAADRYPTVNALKADIERHLRSEPVTVRDRARWYVLGRALKRNRWGVAAGGLVFVSLATGLAGTAWQARRAELERDVARRAATREEAVRYQLTSLFRSSIAQKSDAPVTAKLMLDRSAQRILKEYRDNPQLTGKVVVTLADLYGALGDFEGEGSMLNGFLSAAGPEADRESVALAQQKLAHIELLRGHLPRAAELLPKAEAFWSTAPDKYREQHLEGLLVRGTLQRNQGDLDASIRTYQMAIAERTAFSGAVHRETANLYNSLAITLTGANRLQEALDAYRANLAIYEKLGQAQDLDALIVLGNTGTLAFRIGRLHEAEGLLKTAFEKQREVAGDSAAVSAAMGLYGATLTALGRLPEALAVLPTALDMTVKFVGAGSPLAIQNRLFLTDALTLSGNLPKARELAAQNLAMASERFGLAGVLTLRVKLSLARLELESGRAQPAQEQFEALVEPLRKAGRPGQPLVAHALVGSGEALLAQDKAAQAVAPLQVAVELRQKLLWAQSWELALARARLGEALKRSKANGAAELLNQGSSDLAAQLGNDHPQVLRARRALAAPL